MNIVTAIDTVYYPRVLSMIASICIHDFDRLQNIYVYDIGLRPSERQTLQQMQKVIVCDIEMTNPMIKSKMLRHEKMPGVYVIGLWSFKPVAIKQTLDLPGISSVLWMDAGNQAKASLVPIFNEIHRTGYWFVSASEVWWETTRYVQQELNVTAEEMSSSGINAGMIGISNMMHGEFRLPYTDFVEPFYEYAKNIQLFVDDGTAGGGALCGRHDQALASILVARNKYKIHSGVRMDFPEGIFSVACERNQISRTTIIYQGRGDGMERPLRFIYIRKA